MQNTQTLEIRHAVVQATALRERVPYVDIANRKPALNQRRLSIDYLSTSDRSPARSPYCFCHPYTVMPRGL